MPFHLCHCIYSNYAHLAQWIERQTSNLEVEGSSPPLG